MRELSFGAHGNSGKEDLVTDAGRAITVDWDSLIAPGGHSTVYEAKGADEELLAVKRVFVGSSGVAESAMAERELDVARRISDPQSAYLLPGARLPVPRPDARPAPITSYKRSWNVLPALALWSSR